MRLKVTTNGNNFQDGISIITREMYQNYGELLVEKQDKIVVVKFNNPKKRNCVNGKGYMEITRVVKEAGDDDSTSMVVFTGVGDFYTAGNDLSQTANIEDIENYIQESNAIFKNMVHAFINCPKIIVSLVNGPCIGIGTTLAGISDLVWCSETAYFATPFVKLGIVPEAGSSYLFPLLMGRSKATEVLLFGEKLTAQEAYNCNFVSSIYKISDLYSEVWPKLRKFADLPSEALRISKRLLRSAEKKMLLRAVDAECDELIKRFGSEEFMKALMQFAQRKSKL